MTFRDPKKTEEVKTPTPVAMRISAGAELVEEYFSNGESIVIGIFPEICYEVNVWNIN